MRVNDGNRVWEENYSWMCFPLVNNIQAHPNYHFHQSELCSLASLLSLLKQYHSVWDRSRVNMLLDSPLALTHMARQSGHNNTNKNFPCASSSTTDQGFLSFTPALKIFRLQLYLPPSVSPSAISIYRDSNCRYLVWGPLSVLIYEESVFDSCDNHFLVFPLQVLIRGGSLCPQVNRRDQHLRTRCDVTTATSSRDIENRRWPHGVALNDSPLF